MGEAARLAATDTSHLGTISDPIPKKKPKLAPLTRKQLEAAMRSAAMMSGSADPMGDAMFDVFDADGGGNLDEQEAKRFLSVFGVADAELDECWSVVLEVVDTDGDGLGDMVEDANRNGVVDITETAPRRIATDGDGLTDAVERRGDEWREGARLRHRLPGEARDLQPLVRSAPAPARVGRSPFARSDSAPRGTRHGGQGIPEGAHPGLGRLRR